MVVGASCENDWETESNAAQLCNVVVLSWRALEHARSLWTDPASQASDVVVFERAVCVIIETSWNCENVCVACARACVYVCAYSCVHVVCLYVRACVYVDAHLWVCEIFSSRNYNIQKNYVSLDSRENAISMEREKEAMWNINMHLLNSSLSFLSRLLISRSFSLSPASWAPPDATSSSLSPVSRLICPDNWGNQRTLNLASSPSFTEITEMWSETCPDLRN